MSQPTTLAVRKSITVQAPQARAFEVFTAGMSTWWPLDSHHIGAVPAVATIMDPEPGGRWAEQGEDGSVCLWGTVIEWEPPARVLLGWQLNADWDYEPGLLTELEVRFIPEGDATTRVELEHRGLDVYGERAEEVRSSIDSADGWNGLLATYAAAV